MEFVVRTLFFLPLILSFVWLAISIKQHKMGKTELWRILCPCLYIIIMILSIVIVWGIDF